VLVAIKGRDELRVKGVGGKRAGKEPAEGPEEGGETSEEAEGLEDGQAGHKEDAHLAGEPEGDH
jgi:hypothetical protein